MIELETNTLQICDGVIKQLSSLDIGKLTRLQASTLMAQMRRRIHVEGLDANGEPIGTYTPSYVKYARKKAGRQEGNKVVLSLTRTMENAMIDKPLDENSAGIGYATAEQLQKSKWCEETYGKKIFAPTKEERDLMDEIAKDYINKALNGDNS